MSWESPLLKQTASHRSTLQYCLIDTVWILVLFFWCWCHIGLDVKRQCFGPYNLDVTFALRPSALRPLCVCVCVCVCARARARVSVSVSLSACRCLRACVSGVRGGIASDACSHSEAWMHATSESWMHATTTYPITTHTHLHLSQHTHTYTHTYTHTHDTTGLYFPSIGTLRSKYVPVCTFVYIFMFINLARSVHVYLSISS